MTWLSVVLIRILGTRLYLKIPYRVRRRLGMVRGEDFTELNRTLEQLRTMNTVAAERVRCLLILIEAKWNPLPDGPYDTERDYQSLDWCATLDAAIEKIRDGK